jgi:hypothetical protein
MGTYHLKLITFLALLSSSKDPVGLQYKKLIIVDILLFDLHGMFAT